MRQLASKTVRPRGLREQCVIDAFFELRDLAKTAAQCKIKLAEAERIYQKPEVRAEIDRKIGMVETEIVKQAASRAILDMNLLDRELKKTIKLDPKEHGATKLKAMEMGYGRLGMFREGNFTVAQQSDSNKPSIFRASERTVKRTTEEIIERKVESSAFGKVSDF